MTWETVLIGSLVANAGLAFGYRVYRLSKGGPLADVVGQAILGVLLCSLALLVAVDLEWARWPALVYALLFGVVVMPIWTLGVLIPLPPEAPDYSFTALYWGSLILIGIAALAA